MRPCLCCILDATVTAESVNRIIVSWLSYSWEICICTRIPEVLVHPMRSVLYVHNHLSVSVYCFGAKDTDDVHTCYVQFDDTNFPGDLSLVALHECRTGQLLSYLEFKCIARWREIFMIQNCYCHNTVGLTSYDVFVLEQMKMHNRYCGFVYTNMHKIAYSKTFRCYLLGFMHPYQNGGLCLICSPHGDCASLGFVPLLGTRTTA